MLNTLNLLHKVSIFQPSGIFIPYEIWVLTVPKKICLNILMGFIRFFTSRSSVGVCYFVYARSEGSGGTARMLRLAWAIAARQCDKCHNLLCWSTCVCSVITVLWVLVGRHECLGSHKPSLLASAISTIISCAGPLVFVAVIPYFVHAKSEGSVRTPRMLRLALVIAAHPWRYFMLALASWKPTPVRSRHFNV